MFLPYCQAQCILSLSWRGRHHEATTAPIQPDLIALGLSHDDVTLVDKNPVPDVPTLLLISDGSGTTGERWIDSELDYASNLSNVKTVQLNCGHAVYHEKPEEVKNEMESFIDSLED